MILTWGRASWAITSIYSPKSEKLIFFPPREFFFRITMSVRCWCSYFSGPPIRLELWIRLAARVAAAWVIGYGIVQAVARKLLTHVSDAESGARAAKFWERSPVYGPTDHCSQFNAGRPLTGG